MKIKNLFGISLLGTFICSSLLFAQPIQFQKVYGGVNNDYGNSVCKTIDGGYLIGGSTRSFGAGMLDICLIKTDSIGDTLWTKVYGGLQDDYPGIGIQTSDSGYAIAGSTYSFGIGTPSQPNFLLIKTNSHGDTLWSKTYGGTEDEILTAFQQTSDGGFVLAGYSSSFSWPHEDFYLVKTDANGILQWSKTYGGTLNDFGLAIEQTIDGGYIFAGETDNYGPPSNGNMYAIKTNSIGDTIWTKTYGNGNDVAYSVVETSDTGFAFLGRTYSYGAGSSDCYLVKTDKNGIAQWSKTYGGSYDDNPSSIREYRDHVSNLEKYLYITGDSPGDESSTNWGNYHSFVIKTNPVGVPFWTELYGTGPSDYATTIDLTNDGGIVLAGYSGDFGVGGNDFYLIKSDNNGESGCYDFPDNFSISSPATICLPAGGIVGNPPTVASNAPVIVGNANTIVTTLCPIVLAINDASKNNSGISIFPNPTTANITVTGIKENSILTIYNDVGEIIFAEKTSGEKKEINLEKFSPGIYFMQINSGTEILTKKFIKE